MKLHNLKPTQGVKTRKRVGRGDSSGSGRTCGRGEKGQKSRSGSTYRAYFEGGQIPLYRRLPKRGFKSMSHKNFNIVNLYILDEEFAEKDVIDEKILREMGLIGKAELELKVLGDGEITKALTVRASKFSASAKAKIEAAGGTCEVV